MNKIKMDFDDADLIGAFQRSKRNAIVHPDTLNLISSVGTIGINGTDYSVQVIITKDSKKVHWNWEDY